MTTSLPEAKRIEFANLFQELAESYPFSPEGQEHAASYQESRSQARESLDGLIVASERGEDITEAVLFRLLPYTDSAANRERGLWVSVAPAFATDVRIKFEASGWTDPEDWPRVAQAILEFVRRCDEHPEQLAEACAGFSSLPYSKGFQSGTLTPIIHALRPDDFVLINNKSRRTVNYFAGTAYGQKLVEYPDVNATAKALIGELSSEMEHSAVLDLGDNDRFDMFCHWLVAVKRYEFGSVAYWKIAPGEDAWNWEACRDGGFIAIGTEPSRV
jgi:5-methylcytosine-specific restriction protein B